MGGLRPIALRLPIALRPIERRAVLGPLTEGLRAGVRCPILVLMPIYVYESVPDEGRAPETYEFQQKMSDPPLSHHPVSGVPIRRVMSAPFLAGFATDGPSRTEAEGPPARGGCGLGYCGMAGACGRGEVD